MADWKDELLPASFRDVPFFVERSEGLEGRQTVVHRLPSRPRPLVQDMGQLAREHAIEAYVIGDRAIAERDQLRQALGTAGSGTLVHPYLGTLTGYVHGGFRMHHSTRESRIVRFAFLFVETEDAIARAAPEDPEAAAKSAEAAASTSASESFNQSAKVENQPAWLLESFEHELGRVAERLNAVDKNAGAFGLVARITESIAALGQHAVDIVRVGEYPSSLSATLDDLEAAVGSKRAALDFYLALDGHRVEHVGYSGSVGQGADGNAAALERLLRTLSIAAGVRVASTGGWESYDDAIARRDQLAERLDLLGEDADDEAFDHLQSLRAALFSAVPPPDETLPRIERVRPKATTSTLLLAWQLFGNIREEPAIAARNHPEWPGFLTPARELEILVDPA